jgi:pilus assembly protein CpaB
VRRRLLAASAALVLLVIGTLVLVAYVGGADARALAGTSTVEVFVVDKQIPEGTSGDELDEFVTTETIPAMAVVPGRVTDLSALSGRVADADLLVGEQLVTRRFVSPEDRRVAGTVEVPEGLQEISVLLEPQRVVGARLSAGDTVGVYLSQKLPDGTGQTSAVLHSVLVSQLQGAPAPADPAAEGGTETVAAGTPASSLMVTLALTAKDAETVVYGMEHGTLWLSLETDGDETGSTRVLGPNTIYVGVPR